MLLSSTFCAFKMQLINRQHRSKINFFSSFYSRLIEYTFSFLLALAYGAIDDIKSPEWTFRLRHLQMGFKFIRFNSEDKRP